MTKICLCLTAKTIAQNLEILEKHRRSIDIAELRVDCLANEEYEHIRRFPELAGLPVILTVRRKRDGGFFDRGESSRIVVISKALAFAKADRRQNFAYVDLEEDLDTPSLEEVARAFGTRIIRSFHNLSGTDSNLTGHIKTLFRVGDEIAKAAVTPKDIYDVCSVIKAMKELRGKDTIIISMGDIGQCTRILSQKYGGYLTYTSAKNIAGAPLAADGHLDPLELAGLFRFRDINSRTAIYGITGYPLTTTFSPEFHNGVFAREKINAVYLRFPSETIDGFMRLADEIGIRGASITVPHKKSVISYLKIMSKELTNIGACNTIVRTKEGWSGSNTDAPGFSGSLLNLMGRKNLKWLKVTIIGAGGVSYAIVSEIARLGAKALILNRNIHHAKELASKYHFEYGVLEDESEKHIRKFSDILIQTTSVGMAPDIDSDPLPHYHFTGKEVVMDVIYKPEKTKFLSRAIAAGCTTINGYDMLLRQAKHQYTCFFGREFSEGPIKK